MPPAHRRRRRAPIAIVLIVVVVAIGALVAIGFLVRTGDDRTTEARPADGAQQSASPRGVPSPDAAQTRDLLAGLAEIDPALDSPASVAPAREICRGLLRGEENEKLVDLVQQRFNDPAEINKTEAGRIVTLVDGTFCQT